MSSIPRTIIKGVAWIAGGMIVIVVFHLGGSIAHVIGQFSPLTGALIGGCLTLASALIPMGKRENVEHWIGYEQLSWAMIGLGVLMWALGESFWRYYISIGQSPFPSIADIGYSSFPLLAFTGLLLQPHSESGSKRIILLMDSLISMGSILAIAWYLLLGSLAQAPGEANLAKFLGLYYPIADTALLSCVVFLLLRGQGRAYQATARRMGLLVIGLGLCFFVFSDFLFNIQQNAGTYVEATWIDLGWPLGMMTIGVAALFRRFLPSTPPAVIEERLAERMERNAFGPSRLIPYILVGMLFLTLVFNSLSTDSGQQAIRPVLLLATMGVVALIVGRQIYTLWENVNLTRQQTEALEDLARANKQIEEQSRQIAEHNAELERGILHLKDVQAQLANGNLRARANLTSGTLFPLAGSLNLMADRLMRLGQIDVYAQRLVRALAELCIALERRAQGAPVALPPSSKEFPEIERLLISLRLKESSARLPTTGSLPPHPVRMQGAKPGVPSFPPRPLVTPLPVNNPDGMQTSSGGWERIPPGKAPEPRRTPAPGSGSLPVEWPERWNR